VTNGVAAGSWDCCVKEKQEGTDCFGAASSLKNGVGIGAGIDPAVVVVDGKPL